MKRVSEKMLTVARDNQLFLLKLRMPFFIILFIVIFIFTCLSSMTLNYIFPVLVVFDDLTLIHADDAFAQIIYYFPVVSG